MLNDNKMIVCEIAVGTSRKETRWKNGKITWHSLVEKLSKAHHTHETFAYYKSASRDEQDKIKDIGGFVGGYLTAGVRKKGSVAYRTVLTLDADAASPALWATFKLLYGNAACIYSTHKHSPEKPRYRLVMPLNRHCTPEEYEPIARRVAGDLGIEQFDNTGFQVERLMYWPSCSSDGVFEFESQDGPALDVDDTLASYTNWQDISEWPISERVRELIKYNQKKQGDPLEKKGIVGAFCRTYDIEQAIETYLNDIYEKTDIDNRYTYTGGSTSGGLIIYDGKFAYSHHGTDCISGKLCNAFDLVRLHLYGDKDGGTEADTPIEKRPSYQAMRELATQDKEVRHQIGIEKLESAKADFEELGFDFDAVEQGVTEASTEWLADLEVDAQGEYSKTIDNVVMILENDPVLKGAIAFDDFRYRATVLRRLPWRTEGDATQWTDADEANLRWYIEKLYGITGANRIHDAVDVVLKRHAFHPVRSYLESLTWDGVPRIDELLVKHFGAEDSEYVRTVTRKCLAAAVARVYEPGCKYDYMLILKGRQGLRKSMFWDILAGEWFSDTLTTVQGKDAYEQIQGFWVIEIAELASMRKAEREQIKHFVTKREDSFRPAYGRHTVTYKRQCILVGTTNEDDFLKDLTGGRRFWPVEVAHKMNKVEELKRLRGQIWAEAMKLYKAGETLYLGDDMEKEAQIIQSKHTETDDRVEMIRGYLDKLLPENWESMSVWAKREFLNGDELTAEGVNERQRVTALEIYMELFGGSAKDYSVRTGREINEMMRRFEKDWEYKPFRKGDAQVKGFVRRRSHYQKLMEKRFLG